MGTWGPLLYQNDMAQQVRDYYKEQLRKGKSGKEITQELIEQNEYCLSDSDDAAVFWFALADTQWNLGRLEDAVKEKALYYIKEGSDITRWECEDCGSAKIREQALKELEQKILSPQPEEKKVKKHRLYRCEWRTGDIYAYQLKSNYAEEKGKLDKFVHFIKVDETQWYPGHTVPVVYVYGVISDEILTPEKLKTVGFIPQFFVPAVYEREKERKMLYALELLSTSAKVIPGKQLTFAGNIHDIKRMKDEDPKPYAVAWKEFERYIIDDFANWDLM